MSQEPRDLLLFEKGLIQKGFELIAGIDEAGRGPLAGPVVAACVIFHPGNYPLGIRDSKKLTPKKRSKLYYKIRLSALCYSVGIIWHQRIDEINILNATFEAMIQAVNKLKIKPDYVLIDGRDEPIKNHLQKSIIGGDNRSISIAAASIIAKVTRDRIMNIYDRYYPEYGFKTNKGYGSKYHIEKIKAVGRSPIHRKSFRLKFEKNLFNKDVFKNSD
jgi:ribonuclease HII